MIHLNFIIPQAIDHSLHLDRDIHEMKTLLRYLTPKHIEKFA